jgi:hypothetical protein
MAIDVRGINVAVGKATWSSIDTANSYRAVNGRFDNTYASTGTDNQWWEVDLGQDYDIQSIIYFNDSAFTTASLIGAGMQMYLLDSKRYMRDTRFIAGPASATAYTANYIKQVFNFTPTPAPVTTATLGATPTKSPAVIQNYGVKARYVVVSKASAFNMSQIAVIDCLGRNVAYNKSGAPAALVNGNLNSSGSTTVSSSFTIDLGEEYFITEVIGYSANSDNTLKGATVVLQNAYGTQVGTKTFSNDYTATGAGRIVRDTSKYFGNVPYYCAANLAKNATLDYNYTSVNDLDKCLSCPTTFPNRSSANQKCYSSCPTGFKIDPSRDACVEDITQTLPGSVNSKPLATLLSEATTIVSGTAAYSLSDFWQQTVAGFTALFSGRSGATSEATVYANDYVINKWSFSGTTNKLFDTNPFLIFISLTPHV